jgi:hypothetical protein
MPPSTIPSTFNAISSHDRRFGSSEPRQRTSGKTQSRRCDPFGPFGIHFAPRNLS